LDGTALTDPAVPTSGNAPYVIPSSRLGETPNPHTIVVRYTRDGLVHERTTRVSVNPPVRTAEDGTASGNGFALAQVLRVTRPPLVPGEAPAPLNIGSIVTEASVPAGMRVEIRIDNERVGSPIELARDGRTQLTIPATVADGSHSVEFRILDSAGTVRHRFVGQPITIGPSMATFSAASVVMPPSGGGTFYRNDQLQVRFSTTLATAHRARVTVGTHTVEVDVPAGTMSGATREVTLTLPGRPRDFTGVRTGTHDYAVTVTPLGDGGTAGAAVPAGNARINKPGGGGGTPRPRLPGAGGR
jgi:hypothetical protein